MTCDVAAGEPRVKFKKKAKTKQKPIKTSTPLCQLILRICAVVSSPLALVVIVCHRRCLRGFIPYH